MKPYFEQFRHKGIRFLALYRGKSVHIVDANGNNYGSYETVGSFKRFYAKDTAPIGKIRELSFQIAN